MKRLTLAGLGLALAVTGLAACDEDPLTAPAQEASFNQERPGPPTGNGPPSGKGPGANHGPWFHSQIAFLSARGGHNYGLYVMEADGTDVRLVASTPEILNGPAWSPDGEYIAYGGAVDGYSPSDIYVIPADGSGPPTRLTTEGGITPCWLADGTGIVFVRGSDLYVMNTDGTDVTRLTTHPSPDYAPNCSRASNKIVFHSLRGGTWDIWTINADGSGLFQVTDSEDGDLYPAFSPDGEHIAVTRNRPGVYNKDIWIVRADGTEERQLTNESCWERFASWSLDGRRIAYETNRNYSSSQFDIYSVNVDGTDPMRLTDHPATDTDPAWRP